MIYCLITSWRESILFDRKIFKEFQCVREADEWVMKFYGQWLKEIEGTKSNINKNNIGNLLSNYTSSMNVQYNNFLRGNIEFDEDMAEEVSRGISIIAKEICKFSLQENIIVYRYTNKKLFKCLFEFSRPEIGKAFTDKGFISTTLAPDLLKEFAKNHHYNCVLKLYLPKGTKGVYIRFKDGINEQEFLLPPNSTFKLIRKYISMKYNMVYECELVSQ